MRIMATLVSFRENVTMLIRERCFSHKKADQSSLLAYSSGDPHDKSIAVSAFWSAFCMIWFLSQAMTAVTRLKANKLWRRPRRRDYTQDSCVLGEISYQTIGGNDSWKMSESTLTLLNIACLMRFSQYLYTANLHLERTSIDVCLRHKPPKIHLSYGSRLPRCHSKFFAFQSNHLHLSETCYAVTWAAIHVMPREWCLHSCHTTIRSGDLPRPQVDSDHLNPALPPLTTLD